MGKFMEQQEWLKEVKETRKLSREKLGSFFYDLAKIVFTTRRWSWGLWSQS